MTTNFLLTFNIERFYIFDFQFQFIHWFEYQWFLSITSKNHSVKLFIGGTIQINCSIGPIGIASFYLWFENESLSSKYPVAQTGRCTARGSKFWSSKVCEGGESRGEYACRLNFDPPQFLFEINDHVTQTHFWSVFEQFMVMWLINWFKIEFLISLKADQKWVWVTWWLILKRNWGGSKLSLHA